MVQCDVCHKPTAPREKPRRAVIESRTVTHREGVTGKQIVREIVGHAECIPA